MLYFIVYTWVHVCVCVRVCDCVFVRASVCVFVHVSVLMCTWECGCAHMSAFVCTQRAFVGGCVHTHSYDIGQRKGSPWLLDGAGSRQRSKFEHWHQNHDVDSNTPQTLHTQPLPPGGDTVDQVDLLLWCLPRAVRYKCYSYVICESYNCGFYSTMLFSIIVCAFSKTKFVNRN